MVTRREREQLASHGLREVEPPHRQGEGPRLAWVFMLAVVVVTIGLAGVGGWMVGQWVMETMR
jgi:cell division septal protein FtsQ